MHTYDDRENTESCDQHRQSFDCRNDLKRNLSSSAFLSEAISFGFYSKNNFWYNTQAEKIGRLWYVADRKQQVILPC